MRFLALLRPDDHGFGRVRLLRRGHHRDDVMGEEQAQEVHQKV